MDRSDAPRAERRRLTHVDRRGRPRMVDVSAKPPDRPPRRRRGGGRRVAPETMSLVIDGGDAKGDVLDGRRAGGRHGRQAHVRADPAVPPARADRPRGRASRRTAPPACSGSAPRPRRPGPTGVEMEAMTAASVAALTVYDMVKGVERGVEIRALRLVSKTGGKSGEWHRPAGGAGDAGAAEAQARRPDGRAGREAQGRPGEREPRRRSALVLTVSDRSVRRDRGRTPRARRSRSGSTALGFAVERGVVPDEVAAIAGAIEVGTQRHRLVVTTGGTGLTPRDVTPQATATVLDYEVPGIAEAIRAEGAPSHAVRRAVARAGRRPRRVADRRTCRARRRARWSRSRCSSRCSTTRSRRSPARSTTPRAAPPAATDLPPGGRRGG